ncbi:CheB methylesterase domain-containing protein [Geomonas sp.]|uniref:CheB methylesterase domain-containing protein n=1 Tax=Geomonas sp. TaxID=2651584 RepID=UPI002B484126|nr:CheB methylesterase domain-containing protein [Geomonas sp.]HJV35000.1 CheB methylesterase domain-containing protein [Geomonas sp.]
MNGRNLVVIGISTGGPFTLKDLFSRLPRLPAAFLVVLHITPEMDYRIAMGLDAAANMPVALAQHGERLKGGHVYLAPGGLHLQLEGNQRVKLCDGPRVNYVQPSVDVTMLSLGRSFNGGKLIGAIMTGMGKDGAEGILHMKKIGGVTFAQDEASSTIYGMPKAAVETGAIDFVLPPARMADKLVELLR